MSRYEWRHLDLRVHAEIQGRTDVVEEVYPTTHETESDIVATLELASRRRVVIKGVRWLPGQPTHPRAVRLQKEALVLEHIPGALAPRLLTVVDCAEWLVLVLEHIPGTPPDLSPGSRDVAVVSRTLATLAARPQLSPTVMRTVPQLSYTLLGIRPWRVLRYVRPRHLIGWALSQIDEWADRELDLIRLCEGDALVHSAVEPTDVVLTQRAGAVLDWSHAQVGPPWVDLATYAVLLIEHGHDPKSAEELIAPANAWKAAERAAVSAHAVLNYGVWEYRRCAGADDPAITARAGAWLRWAHYQWTRYGIQPDRRVLQGWSR